MKPLNFTDFCKTCQSPHVSVRVGSIEFRFWIFFEKFFFRRSIKCFSIIRYHGSKFTVLTTSYCKSKSSLYATYRQLFPIK